MLSSLPYDPELLDRVTYPEHRGPLPRATHHFELNNTSCGDHLTLDLIIKNGTVRGAAWSGHACAIAVASAELMIDQLTNRPLTDLTDPARRDPLIQSTLPSILDRLPARGKCALLPWTFIDQLEGD